MSIYDPQFLKHYFRSEPDEELNMKLIFTTSKSEGEMLKLEIERRAKENAKLSERVL
ncbi:hypothetical protein QFZ77_002419 [Paenibacillus sp. V4I3]|uniref:hypothetical protein n=1 Tax=Paenibacillus sp. V4I3 TaxID=3042305 RepID=UPI00278002BF|nr:hypothetical protein [Paenibacillus sp. V4I3]MDQ0873760.1 hypothetical protein [Paenibacillus sp. V4I3]